MGSGSNGGCGICSYRNLLVARGGGLLLVVWGGRLLLVVRGRGLLLVSRGGGLLHVARGGGLLLVARGGGLLLVARGGGQLLDARGGRLLLVARGGGLLLVARGGGLLLFAQGGGFSGPPGFVGLGSGAKAFTAAWAASTIAWPVASSAAFFLRTVGVRRHNLSGMFSPLSRCTSTLPAFLAF